MDRIRFVIFFIVFTTSYRCVASILTGVMPVAGKPYYLTSGSNDCCLETPQVAGTAVTDATRSGHQLVAYAKIGSSWYDYQNWYVVPVPGTSNYVIVNVLSNLALDSMAGYNGAITQEILTCSATQQVTLESTGTQGSYYLHMNDGSGDKLLSDNSQNPQCNNNTAYLSLAPNNSALYQIWSFTVNINSTWTPVFASCPTQPVIGVPYYITDAIYGCVLESPGSTANQVAAGNTMMTYQNWGVYYAYYKSQNWYIAQVPGSSNYVIINAISNLALDSTGGTLRQQPLTCGPTQQVTLEVASSTTFYIHMNPGSGDVVLSDVTQNPQCLLFAYTALRPKNSSDLTQLWSFAINYGSTFTPPVVSCPGFPVVGKPYYLKNVHNGCFMETPGSVSQASAVGLKLITEVDLGATVYSQQNWYIAPVPGTLNYTILNVLSNLPMDCTNNIIAQYNLTCGPRQQVTLEFSSTAAAFYIHMNAGPGDRVLSDYLQTNSCHTQYPTIVPKNTSDSSQLWMFVLNLNSTWTPVNATCPPYISTTMTTTTPTTTTPATSISTAITTTTTEPTSTTSAALILQTLGVTSDVLKDPNSLAITLQEVSPFLFATLNESMKEQIGQQYSDMIRICTYSEKDCSDKSNFQYLYNPTYGNCFSFNFGVTAKYYVDDVGPNYGLRILLHASQNEYACASQTAGFRIAFHQNNLPVYPEFDGYNIPPGASSVITLDQSITTLLGQPYTRCADSNNVKYGVNYTVDFCLKKCLQNYLVEQCQCSDPRYPLISNATICPTEKMNCLNYATQCLFESTVNNCDCPAPCKDVHYYPTLTFLQLKSLNIYKNTYCRNDANISLCEATFDQNFAILSVYYRSLQSLAYNEVATYGISNLLSDFSNVTGLLLGVCVITIPEIIAFFFSVISTVCKRLVK